MSLEVVLIGNRPGLSFCNRSGAELRWHPQPGRTDAERNCISNSRQRGLNPARAAVRILWYLNAVRAERIIGISLKEGSNKLSAG